MSDSKWWFNRIGRVAPVSNPGQATPNYGLTYDTATAPAEPDEFDTLAAALTSFAQSVAAATPNAPLFVTGAKDETIWDHAKGGLGWAGNQALSLGGEIENVVRAPDAIGQYDQDWSWSGAREDFKHDLGVAADAPGPKQIFWGLEKLNEYSTTAIIALDEESPDKIFNKKTWVSAHDITVDRHLNFGEATMAAVSYHPEVIRDEERFDQIRQHNTVFNVGALAFNVVAAWKLDPNVLFGKTLGTGRDLYQAKLSTSPRSLAVQREVLSAPDLETAKTAAGSYSGLADKLRASHAISLYDRGLMLRDVARETSAGDFSFEKFKDLPAFKNSASGSTMAKLFVDVANDDEAWNLTFRSALGDPDSLKELALRQGEVGDKIAAIELKTLPSLERDLTSMEDRYNKRLAAQGRPQDAAIEITSFGDNWLHDEVTSLRARADEVNAHLATYKDHESWIQRAMPGFDEETGALDSRAGNSIYGNLDRLGSKNSLQATGGKVSMWRHDDYSPAVWMVRAPTKPFLKRIGVVDLNDVDEGTHALVGYLDQMGHLGHEDQALRDDILSRFTGTITDTERKAVAEHAEREGIKALGAKWDLSPHFMDLLAGELQANRRLTWSKLGDRSLYSPLEKHNYVEDVDASGNMTRVKMPVDPSQLSNFHSLTNLTDLDRTIRQNLDSLRDLDEDLVGAVRAGVSKTERRVTSVVDHLGTTFNSFWKPLALISVRWPMRVVADESMRVMLKTGVLAHLARWGEGATNTLYNQGVIRPYEWWAGRKVKTGSLSEDSLRTLEKDWDGYDYRAAVNPNGAVPADALDYGKIDIRRYNRLNEHLAEREQHLRTLEADRFRATTNPAPNPEWANQWDERLTAAETSDARGFFFDPVTRKMSNKGFAVSLYPGRVRTFPRKPTAREMNFWTQKNSDVLGIPNSRVAVWLDKDTGRWHLDVVKVTKRREDAALLASRAEATEFYDIEDGFTRFLSEENFWGHFDSPLVKPTTEPSSPVSPDVDVPDEAGAEIGASVTVGGPRRRKVGFGMKKFRSRKGKTFEYEDVFGPDTKNPNVYYATVSSKSAIENLYGGHTWAIRKDRGSRTAHDYKMFHPDEGQGTPKEWAEAYAYFVNNHMRYSPMFERMMDGQSDDKIYDWLMSTAKGRAARKRMGIRGENPAKWLSDEREIFEHMLPTERSLQAARVGEVSPQQVLEMFPEGDRPFVHGDSFKLALGQHKAYEKMQDVVSKVMEVASALPTDALVRHPFATTVYRREMRRYLASVDPDKVTNNVIAAASASARAKSLREVRRTLYNIADELEGVHMLRFVSPFLQAQMEVLQRWARISMEKPETVARLALLIHGSQVINNPFWHVTDREGNAVDGYHSDNLVTFQVAPWMDKFLPGDPLKYAGDFTVPAASLNLITQGENPFLPGLGPLVTYPASEFYYKDRAELEDSKIYQWLFPFGQPKGDSASGRIANTLLPAYARRLMTAETEDFNDSAFARRTGEIGAQQLLEWEQGGREGPRPTDDDAIEAAKNEYRLRAATSFFLPAPVTPRSPYQFWIDQYRQYKEKYKQDADEKFYDDYGPDYFLFAQQATESTGGMGPNIGEKQAYGRYKDLAQRAPLLTGVLTGPFATAEFSDAVYQWQLATRIKPASDEHLREHLDPSERIVEAEVNRGWVEYGKLTSAIEAEIRNRMAQGGSPYITTNSNADLAEIKAQKIQEIIARNPAWNGQLTSRTDTLPTFLGQAYDIAFDAKLDGRTDIEALRTYLISRARLQDALIQRAEASYQTTGKRSSDQLSFDPMGNPVGNNADLGMAWLSYVNELNGRNPLFAEIYNRYLEGDDLSTYISPEVSGAVS